MVVENIEEHNRLLEKLVYKKGVKMTRISALPVCKYRYGRTDIVEIGDGPKKTARLMLCCGYREVDAEDCIMCTGFTDANVKFEFKVETFMKMTKDLRFKGCRNSKSNERSNV